MANVGLTEPVIRQQAVSAIQVVVQMARLRDGSRKVSSIAEVIGATDEGVETRRNLSASSAPASTRRGAC